MMKKIVFLPMFLLALAVASCLSPQSYGNANGGEVTGVGTAAVNEPVPYGMVLVERGSIRVGEEEADSLWGAGAPAKDISVDAFCKIPPVRILGARLHYT